MRVKSMKLVECINEILAEYEMPLTIRQIYYQLASRQVIENSVNSYKNFDRIAVEGRRKELIDARRIIDRSKPLIKEPSWNGINSFLYTVRRSYKKSVWDSQPEYVEVWIEKDALSGVFEPTTNAYDCYLAVGRGYQSYSNKMEAIQRFEDAGIKGKNPVVLYFGDFDPTGLDISRDLREEFAEANVAIERIALNRNQIIKYNLPSIPTKKTDSRTAKHIAKYGDIAVELDALPPDVLAKLCKDAIMNHFDSNAFRKVREEEKEDLSKIGNWVEAFQQELNTGV